MVPIQLQIVSQIIITQIPVKLIQIRILLQIQILIITLIIIQIMTLMMTILFNAVDIDIKKQNTLLIKMICVVNVL